MACGSTTNVATTTPLITTSKVGMHSPQCTLTTPGIPAGGTGSHNKKEHVARVELTVDVGELTLHAYQIREGDLVLFEFEEERCAARQNGSEYRCASDFGPPCRVTHANPAPWPITVSTSSAPRRVTPHPPLPPRLHCPRPTWHTGTVQPTCTGCLTSTWAARRVCPRPPTSSTPGVGHWACACRPPPSISVAPSPDMAVAGGDHQDRRKLRHPPCRGLAATKCRQCRQHVVNFCVSCRDVASTNSCHDAGYHIPRLGAPPHWPERPGAPPL